MRTTSAASLLMPFALFAACSGDDSSDPDATPQVVAGMPVDAFILMARSEAGSAGIHLVDPATGKASAREQLLDAVPDGAVAISPDHRLVAWIGHGDAGREIVIGRPMLDAEGRPELEVLHAVRSDSAAVRWSPDGDRVIGYEETIDPETGAVVRCPDDDPAGNAVAKDGVMPVFPGSLRHICPEGEKLYDGDAYAGDGGYGPGPTTADGQLWGLTLHVPSASRRDEHEAVAFDDTWISSGLPHLLRPSGETLVAARAINGKYVVEYNCDSHLCWEILTSDILPQDSARYDVPTLYAERRWEPLAERFPSAAPLRALLADGDGRGWNPFGLLDGDDAVLYLMRSWIVVEGDLAPAQLNIDDVLVEIGSDGTSRTLRTSTLLEGASSDAAFILSDGRYFDLADGWLAAGTTPDGNGQRPHLYGYLDDAVVHYPGYGDLTPDGRWLYGFRRTTPNPNEPGLHCFRERAGAKRQGCLTQAARGKPIGFVGRGSVTPPANGLAPSIHGLSRAGAWPGSEVVVFGSDLGDTGALFVGDTQVPAADIIAWSDHAIRFRMSSALPAQGKVRVATDVGDSAGRLDWTLARTELIDTPFAGMSVATIPLAQGINLVDLGVPVEAPGDPYFRPELRLADGRFAVWSEGASPAAVETYTLRVGDDTRELRLALADRLADPARWQLVATEAAVTMARDGVGLVDVAGLLVERLNGRVPVLPGAGEAAARVSSDGRLVMDVVDPRLNVGEARERGLPDTFREAPGGAWTASDFAASAGTPVWALRFLTGWEQSYFGFRPRYAATPRRDLPPWHLGIAAIGQTLVSVGVGGDNLDRGGFALSTDGGATFGAILSPPEASVILREPIAVDATSGPHFLVLEGWGDISGVHRLDLDGTLTRDVLPPPPGARLQTLPEYDDWMQQASVGGHVLVWFSSSRTLSVADLDAATPTWMSTPNIRHVWIEPGSHDAYATTDAGVVRRATAATGWSDWSDVDLAFDLDADTIAVPRAVARRDGRWVVLADLFDGRPGAAPGTRSPVAPAGWLLGPE